MSYQEVFAAFLRLSGLTEEEGQAQKPLLEAAIRFLAAQLKEPADALPGGNDPRLNEAAAAIAYSRYLLTARSTTAAGQYRLGDLSVSLSEGSSVAADAARLKQEALLSIADRLRDPQFIVCKA